MHSTLISTDLLAAHLNDSSWLITDCRYNLTDEAWGEAQYAAGHIPGAVFVSLAHDLAAARSGANGRHPLPQPEVIAATFGRLGIGNQTQVIAYDQDAGAFASRLWWMLRYIGHDAVAVLDGGFAKWTREGRTIRSGLEKRPSTVLTPRVQSRMRLTVDEVKAHLGDDTMLLVDARSPGRFEGQPDPLDRVFGHIPGAHNRHYRNNISPEGTLRPAGELRKEFAGVLGDRPPEDVVMYCGSGVTACHNRLAMEHAGLRGARLFAGSWSEWEADPDRPVERANIEGRSK
jgi:thiosulfate/3-mercaptopyruvate sulfurtransferase